MDRAVTVIQLLVASCLARPYLGVFAALIFYYIVSSVLAWYRLRYFRGPWLATFSYLWLLRTTRSGHEERIYTALHQRYGSLIRISPNDLATCDPDVIRHMSAVRSPYVRSDWYTAMRFSPDVKSLGNTLDTEAHDQLKAKMAAGYSGRENPNFEKDIDDQVNSMVRLIKDKYISSGGELKPIDLARLPLYFTLDSISKVAFGQEFGFLKTDSDVFDYIKVVYKHTVLMMVCGNIPALRQVVFSRWFLGLVGAKSGDEKGLGRVMRYDHVQTPILRDYEHQWLILRSGKCGERKRSPSLQARCGRQA